MQHAIDTHRVRPTPLSERGPVDVLIDSYADRKDLLISLLQEIQGELGYLPKSVLSETSQRLGIPLSRVYAVVTFFRAFSLKPRGRHVVTVCMGTACHVKGAKRLVDKIER
ncbi:MAG: NAD(P)H-dependent oxidoreductase subunit E, partial [Chloroflexota bacterium]|nr:NAD(P)H-dependent oxidoreductase subunit E [Chloroflexota bacterium]